MNRLLAARYTMIADFYEQKVTRSEAGQVIREWDRENPYTIKNLTEAVLTEGFRSVSVSEVWSKDYEPQEYAKMYIANQAIENEFSSPVLLTRRFRVGNIRDRMSKKVIWMDDFLKPMEFNVLGVSPVNDPFGNIVEYELLLRSVIDK